MYHWFGLYGEKSNSQNSNFSYLLTQYYAGEKNWICKNVFQRKIPNSKLEVTVLKHLSNNIQKTINSEKRKYVQLVQGVKKEKEKFMSDAGILIPSLQPEEWELSWTESGN